MAFIEFPEAWQQPGNQPVATMFTTHYVDGIGRVHVSLFGSPHNIRDGRPEDAFWGRTPSNADGLYELLQATREPEDVQLNPEFVVKDRGHGWDEETQANLAADLVYGVDNPLPSRTLDVLIKPFLTASNLSLRGQTGALTHLPHDLVVVGTALWAGPPARRADPALVDPAGQARVLKRAAMDELVFDFADARRRGLQAPYPHEALTGDREDWLGYADWFVDLAHRRARPVTALRAQRSLRSWDPRRYSGVHQESFLTGHHGVLVHVGDDAVLVTSDGLAIRVVDVRLQEALYWPDDDHRALGRNEQPRGISDGHLAKVRAEMWFLAATWSLQPY